MSTLVVYQGEPGPRQLERFAEVAERHDLRIEVCLPADREHLEDLLPEMDVWWHILSPITAAHMDRAPRLRLIHKWGVGVNTIDVAAATERGVATANMAGSNAAAVVEATLLLMLATLRRVTIYHQATAAGRGWKVDPGVGERCGELAGRTVGIVGFGDIGQRLGHVLSAMGAEVIHHARRTDRPGWVTLDDLLERSDVVSLHIPLTDDTAGLINGRRLASMRSGSVLVNTARGGLVDLDALAASLASGHLGAAGLDVFPDEPNDGRHPIFGLDNVVVTPHVAWLTWETLERSLDLAVDNVERLRRGDPLAGRVG